MNWPYPAFMAKLVLLCICMFEHAKGADLVESWTVFRRAFPLTFQYVGRITAKIKPVSNTNTLANLASTMWNLSNTELTTQQKCKPGHGLSKQCWVSFRGPTQSNPPCCGGGLVQFLERDWVPFPQVWLQGSQGPHDVKLPSTGDWEKKIEKLHHWEKKYEDKAIHYTW